MSFEELKNFIFSLSEPLGLKFTIRQSLNSFSIEVDFHKYEYAQFLVIPMGMLLEVPEEETKQYLTHIIKEINEQMGFAP